MSFRVARVSGVPIVIHVTWIITFLLLSYAIGLGFIAQADPSLSPFAAVSLGTVAALLLFVCILCHECGHVLCARRFGIRTSSVDLFLLGGEAHLLGDCRDCREELAVAASGPAVNIALAGVFAACSVVFGTDSVAGVIAFYLAFANAVLAAANLLPAYPLDGGRGLQAIVWAVTKDKARSTRAAAIFGEGTGLAVAAYGAFTVLQVGVSGLWPIVFGWYVFDAASRARGETDREVSSAAMPHPAA